MSVERGWWDKPVRIERDRYGRWLNVSSSAQADRILHDEWPVDPGPKHFAARKAVFAPNIILDVPKSADYKGDIRS